MRDLSKRYFCRAANVFKALVIGFAVASGIGHSAEPADDAAVTDLPLSRVADFPLPGRATRLDYTSYDPERHLLFIAHLGDSEVIAFDTRTSRVVARIQNIAEVHGVLVVPEMSRVFATATGTNEVVSIDEATLKIFARMPGGVYPDGMAYAPDARKLYVSDETGGTETVIDTVSNRRMKTIEIGGTIGNTQYDAASRHIFVNAQSRRQLIEIDPSNDTIVARIDLPGAKGNHGLQIVPQARLAFVACQDNARLLQLNLLSRQVVQTFEVGEHPDVLAFDAGLSVLYVAGEAGVVSMFAVRPSGVTKIGEGSIAPNAHVVSVDPTTHRVYFPLKNIGGRPMLRVMQPR